MRSPRPILRSDVPVRPHTRATSTRQAERFIPFCWARCVWLRWARSPSEEFGRLDGRGAEQVWLVADRAQALPSHEDAYVPRSARHSCVHCCPSAPSLPEGVAGGSGVLRLDVGRTQSDRHPVEKRSGFVSPLETNAREVERQCARNAVAVGQFHSRTGVTDSQSEEAAPPSPSNCRGPSQAAPNGSATSSDELPRWEVRGLRDTARTRTCPHHVHPGRQT